MSKHDQKYVLRIDPACRSAVAALEYDPFYRSICGADVHDATRRRAVLEKYFAYSIQEGRDIGRCVHLADAACGVAVWLLPQPPDVQSSSADKKRLFLETTLDAQGYANYYRIVDFMKGQTGSVIASNGWYLSIVAVDPVAQGRGLGQELLQPTIAEAEQFSAVCYLETFSPRNVRFYERLGFATRAQFSEPTTDADYVVMVRYPKKLKKEKVFE